MEWYKYRLIVRGDADRYYLHRFGKLFQLFIVDMHTKMGANRLGFICHNQKRLWADLYCNVTDAMNVGDNDMAIVEERGILPSSFTRSPQHMQQLYQNVPNGLLLKNSMEKPLLKVDRLSNLSTGRKSRDYAVNQGKH